jgi:hypothetical protein
MLVAECKWGRVDARDLETLRRRRRLIAEELGGSRIIHHALIAGAGSLVIHRTGTLDVESAEKESEPLVAALAKRLCDENRARARASAGEIKGARQH